MWLAKKAVAARERDANYWNTLGVAHYRNGDDKAAVAELETATSLRETHKPTELRWICLLDSGYQAITGEPIKQATVQSVFSESPAFSARPAL